MKPDQPIFSLPAASRRRARVVSIGPLKIGGDHPILIQSMTVTDTMKTEEVLAEIRELVEAGCPLVRLTAPSIRDAENLREIRRRLASDGIRVPMVADIHFTPNAALLAAEIVEKVRINPGNYADRKRFEVREYLDREYGEELERVRERFLPLVRRLKECGSALRIGVNHGSLSDRIMNRYGDTPAGMVESALEFVRFCEAEGYREIVVSMKSSIPSVMVAAYRLLARRMAESGMDYPFHLGVTEAGDGLEARLKSAVGMGTLLLEGIGDTIRISLTEASKFEIPAARALLEGCARVSGPGVDEAAAGRERAPAALQAPDALQALAGLHAPGPRAARRHTQTWMLGGLPVGGDAPIRVEQRILLNAEGGILAAGKDLTTPPAAPGSSPGEAPLRAEILSIRLAAPLPSHSMQPVSAVARFRAEERLRSPETRPILLEWDFFGQGEVHLLEALLPHVEGLSLDPFPPESPAGPGEAGRDGSWADRIRLVSRLSARYGKALRWRLSAAGHGASGQAGFPEGWAGRARILSDLGRDEGLEAAGFICSPGPGVPALVRAVAAALAGRGDLIFLEAPCLGPDAALSCGPLLVDGIGDALCLIADGPREDASEAPFPEAWPVGGRSWKEEPVSSAYAILQTCRARLTRAEFIACPSCGRTQFDLMTTTALIRSRTEHLRGVKIAIMGCIVNGPGEMADADFGYVGSGPGKVDLYCAGERVAQGIAAAAAPDRLCELIREKGKWVDP